MKLHRLISAAFSALFGSVILLANGAAAGVQSTQSFTLITGEVVTTPARCVTKVCPQSRANISGTFVSQISMPDQITFLSSALITAPNTDFQLPINPNESNYGTVRSVTFGFDGAVLKVKGVVDSRAFDGPLVEYVFSAKLAPEVSSRMSFFTVRQDYRKCVSPLCGGFFVKAVNKRQTMCADGSRQNECYVANIDFDGPALGEYTQVNNPTALVVAGQIAANNDPNFGNLGTLKVKAAYFSATQTQATMPFYGLDDEGIVCITSPCFSYGAQYLNRHTPTQSLSEVNLRKVGASDEAVMEAEIALAEGQTLIATGKYQKYRGFAGAGVRFVAQQFYLPIKPVLSVCEEGYSFFKEACRTPFGCEYPLWELTGIGGAPFVDPITGEITSSTTKSCVKSCDFPAAVSGPGQCMVFYP